MISVSLLLSELGRREDARETVSMRLWCVLTIQRLHPVLLHVVYLAGLPCLVFKLGYRWKFRGSRRPTFQSPEIAVGKRDQEGCPETITILVAQNARCPARQGNTDRPNVDNMTFLHVCQFLALLAKVTDGSADKSIADRVLLLTAKILLVNRFFATCTSCVV